MAERESREIPIWLREAAQTLEELAVDDGSPAALRHHAEDNRLERLVEEAAHRIAQLRLSNLQDSLADVEDVISGLQRELALRQRENRGTRLTEQLLVEAGQERARLLQMISGAVKVPGILPRTPEHVFQAPQAQSTYRSAHPPLQYLGSPGSPRPDDVMPAITSHFLRFYETFGRQDTPADPRGHLSPELSVMESRGPKAPDWDNYFYAVRRQEIDPDYAYSDDDEPDDQEVYDEDELPEPLEPERSAGSAGGAPPEPTRAVVPQLEPAPTSKETKISAPQSTPATPRAPRPKAAMPKSFSLESGKVQTIRTPKKAASAFSLASPVSPLRGTEGGASVRPNSQDAAAPKPEKVKAKPFGFLETNRRLRPESEKRKTTTFSLGAAPPRGKKESHEQTRENLPAAPTKGRLRSEVLLEPKIEFEDDDLKLNSLTLEEAELRELEELADSDLNLDLTDANLEDYPTLPEGELDFDTELTLEDIQLDELDLDLEALELGDLDLEADLLEADLDDDESLVVDAALGADELTLDDEILDEQEDDLTALESPPIEEEAIEIPTEGESLAPVESAIQETPAEPGAATIAELGEDFNLEDLGDFDFSEFADLEEDDLDLGDLSEFDLTGLDPDEELELDSDETNATDETAAQAEAQARAAEETRLAAEAAAQAEAQARAAEEARLAAEAAAQVEAQARAAEEARLAAEAAAQVEAQARAAEEARLAAEAAAQAEAQARAAEEARLAAEAAAQAEARAAEEARLAAEAAAQAEARARAAEEARLAAEAAALSEAEARAAEEARLAAEAAAQAEARARAADEARMAAEAAAQAEAEARAAEEARLAAEAAAQAEAEARAAEEARLAAEAAAQAEAEARAAEEARLAAAAAAQAEAEARAAEAAAQAKAEALAADEARLAAEAATQAEAEARAAEEARLAAEAATQAEAEARAAEEARLAAEAAQAEAEARAAEEARLAAEAAAQAEAEARAAEEARLAAEAAAQAETEARAAEEARLAAEAAAQAEAEAHTAEEALTEPAIVAEALTEPAIVAEALAEPAIVAEALAEPAIVAEALAEPAIVAEALAEPAIVAEALTEPAIVAEALTEPAIVAEALAEPAIVAEALTEPAIVAETLTEPAIVAEALTEPAIVAEALTEPAIVAEALTEPADEVESLLNLAEPPTVESSLIAAQPEARTPVPDLPASVQEELVSSGDIFSTSPASLDDLLSEPTIPTAELLRAQNDDIFGAPEVGGADIFSGASGDGPNWLTESPQEAEPAAAVAVAEAPVAPVTPPPTYSDASPKERRKLVRLSCDFEGTAYFEGRPIHGRIMDISLGGMKFHGPVGLVRGQLVQVANPLPEARSGDPVRGRVVWLRGQVGHNQDIGLQFEESPETLGRSWVITVLNKIGMQSKVFNQRKFTRAIANLPVDIEMPTKEILQGTAIDIGLGGALIATERPFTPTTRFNIAVGPLGNHEKLKVRAEVIQSRHDEEKGHWGQSVKFIEMGPSQTKLLGRYVVDLLKTSGSV